MKKVYTCYHKDQLIVKRSSSGGAFSAISNILLNYKNTSIYGAAVDEQLNVKHIRATTFELRDSMRGSKYVASDISTCFLQISNDLKEGMYVLFTGTPCQVFAIKQYLEKNSIDTSKYYSMEVVCHGVAEKNFFNDYIKHLEKKYKSKAININFRRKKYKGNKQDIEIDFLNKKKYYGFSTNYDWFYNAYLRNYTLRKSCYNCKFANPIRFADFTVADNWNNNIRDESLLIINSQKGLGLLESIKKEMNIIEIEKEKINVPNYYSSSKKPENYNQFLSIYNSKGYLAAQKFLGNNTLKTKCKVKIIYVLHLLGLKNILKRIIKK